MEPLSALSLFCNIVDLCDRTTKICKDCREMYRSVTGRRARDEELKNYLCELQRILHSMSASASKLTGEGLFKSIKGPLDCMETKSAAALGLLHEFRTDKPGNRLATVIATARVVRGQGKLDRILQELKQHRDDVHFAIAQSTR